MTTLATAPITERSLTIQERWTLLEQSKPDLFREYKETCQELYPDRPVIDHSTPDDNYTAKDIDDVTSWLDQHGIPRTRLAA